MTDNREMNNSELKISKVLRYYLETENMTIRSLSGKLDIPMSTLFNYLAGSMPRSPDHIRKMCEYFKISSDELLFDIKPYCQSVIKKGDIIEGRFKVVAIIKEEKVK